MELVKYQINKDSIYLVNKSDLKEILKTGVIKETEVRENIKEKVYVVKEVYNTVIGNKPIIKILVLKNKLTNKLSDSINKIDRVMSNLEEEITSLEYDLGKISIDEYLTIKYEMTKRLLNNKLNIQAFLRKNLLTEGESTKEELVNRIVEEIYTNSNYKQENMEIISDEIEDENENTDIDVVVDNEIQFYENEEIEEYDPKRFEIVNSRSNIEKLIKTIIEAKKDNNILVISEKHNKIYLPYSIDELEDYLKNYPRTYGTLRNVVEREFVIELDNFYKHPTQTRFSEAYNLVKYREGERGIRAFAYAMKTAPKQKLNPAIIAACKNRKELNNYMKCLKENNLKEFKYFDIVATA